MSMNIGPMLRALLGEQPADAGKALELRVGQIVRGVLLEMLDDHDALISINGVHVRAKLDAEMPVGRGTLLQVQPNSGGGLIALKPLPDPAEAMPEESLAEARKALGLPDQKWASELVRGLKRDGYPVGRDTASFYQTAAALRPPGVDAQSWMGASDVAFRRGLQPTEATIASLRQALYGEPLHDALNNMRTALSAWLGGSGGEALPKEAAAIGQRLQSLLSQGAALLEQPSAYVSEEDGESNPAPVPRESGGPSNAAAAPREQTAAKEQTAAAGKGEAAAKPNAAGSLPVASEAAASEEASEPFRSTRETNAASQARTADTPERTRTPANLPSGAAAEPASAPATRAALPPSGADTARALAEGRHAAAPKADADSPWIGRFLQWLGVGHEHQLTRELEARPPGAFPVQDPDSAGQAQAQSQDGKSASDTLKSALLSLAAHDDAPPALREAAQTLAAQVTGQQLLLSTERGHNAPYSHMTLFVPMRGADGETTATIHVQTRRGRKGEWDADNCRLLFDLRMKNLGDTVVDVQVVDRIVSLKILNDYAGMQPLLDGFKEELAEGMSSAGFQLLSLSAGALPSWKSASSAASSGTEHADKAIPAGVYSSKPYKGVDYRA